MPETIAGINKSSLRKGVFTALAFACLLVYCRAFTSDTVGRVFDLGSGSALELGAICSELRLVTVALLMVLGCSRRRIFNKGLLVAAAMAMSAAAVVLLVGESHIMQALAAGCAGVASGVAMFALMLVLSDESFRTLVISSLCGLVIGGALIGVLMSSAGLVAGCVMIIVGAGSGLCPVLTDRDLTCFDDHGTFSVAELKRFPWFASVMLVVCGVLGSMLYSAASTLSWGVMAGPSYPVMGLCALVVIVGTCATIVCVPNWTQLVWVPLFVLLACSLAVVVTNTTMLDSAALGLLFAIMMSFHFLRWVVFPAIVSTSLLPRYFTNGVFLVITNAALALQVESRAFESLPAGLQTPSGLGGTMSLMLAVVFAVVLLVARMGQAPEYEESTAAVPQKTDSAAVQEEETSAEPEGAVEQERSFEERCEDISHEFSLTARESEILALTARGHSSSRIAEQLFISSSTVRFHQQNLYKKLGVHSKQELIEFVESRA